jgi:hypothetical protein
MRTQHRSYMLTPPSMVESQYVTVVKSPNITAFQNHVLNQDVIGIRKAASPALT